ncbi:TonB-dependent siderophore receptor [Azoarcus indigens]|uniref:Iron complex outermembrane receptor protein n=1 Tax=Azoarcus indigens TaxID=29545 RepID=A0A4R6DSR6_9RHOO|nr:TonB-dependent receptor [Azoarcus indigens]NMG67035.1 TonB-dependent siderophore receptor [Azoarcus indigens]TDN48175.1 iron complex outermembrane receptor protein [Azoarcus indigens]
MSQSAPVPSRRPLAIAVCKALPLLAAASLLAAPATHAAEPPAASARPLQLAQAGQAAQADIARSYHIAAGPLSTVLGRYASAAGVALSFDPEATRGLESAGLQGDYTVAGGFAALLAGSGLEAVAQGDGQYTLRRRPAGSPSTLRQVTVTATATRGSNDLPDSYAGGQVARGARIGLLGNMDTMDTPFNTTAYTAQLIADQQASTVAEVLQNDPSVRFTTSEGHIYENFSIRGFDINADDMAFEGLYGIAPYGHVATEFIERVEVFKGPGALLTGMAPQGGVGGIVNLVPKRAGDTPLTQLTLDYTTKSQFGVHADVGRRFGPDDRFGIRVNGAWRDGKTSLDHQEKERTLAAVALDYRGDQLKLTLDAYTSEETIDGGSAWMASFASKVVSPPDTGTNLLRGIHGKLENQATVLRGEYSFNDHLEAYASLGTLRYRYSGYINGTRAGSIQPNGNYTGQTYNQAGGNDTVSAEAGLRARFATGSVHHQLTFAVTNLDYDSYRANPGNSTNYASNIYNPATPRLGADPGHAPKSGDTTLSSVALADTLSFADDKLLLILGARSQRVQSKTYNVSTGATTEDYDERALTPALGIVIKPWAAPVSLYANYIEGLSKGQNVTLNNGDIQSFAPFKTEQIEVGVKWDASTVGSTLALFQITRPSLIQDTATGRYSDDGEQRNRGIEWSAYGELNSKLRLLGGVAYTDAVFTRSANHTYDDNHVYGVPKWKANLGAEWTVPGLRALTLSGRIVHTGEQYVNTANTQKIPNWTRFDLGARYATRLMGKALMLRANVENVADKSYWAGSFNDGYVTQGAGRTVKLSATMDF